MFPDGLQPWPVVGAMTRVLQGAPLPEALGAIAAAGLRDVGLLGRHAGRLAVPEEASDAEVRAIGREVAAFGLKPVLLWCGAITPPREALLLRCLEQAELLGLRWVLGRGPGWPGPDAPAHQVEREHADFLTLLRALAGQAARQGARVALKPHGGPRSGSGAALAATVRRVGAPNLDVFYDPGNVRFYDGLDPCQDVVPVAPSVAGLCIKDHRGPRGEACFPTPGDGDVRWVEFLRPLRAAGLDGPLLIERCSGGDAPAVAAELQRVHRRLGEWWQLGGPAV